MERTMLAKMYIDRMFQEVNNPYAQAGLPQSFLKKFGSDTQWGSEIV